MQLKAVKSTIRSNTNKVRTKKIQSPTDDELQAKVDRPN